MIRPAAKVARRWRDYATASGRRPVKEFIDELSDEDAATVIAAMKEVKIKGLKAARHLDGDIYEVRADGSKVIYRVLFVQEGKRGQVLLALVGLKKKTQKAPPQTLRLAKTRLRDWRCRGAQQRHSPGSRS